MTNKSKQTRFNKKVAVIEKQMTKLAVKNKPKKKATPFATTGSIIGRSIGGMFGNQSIGSGVGKWLGSGIGSIFGSGDYTLAGTKPQSNVLTNGSQIPKFSTTRQTNIVSHREYLGDINGTAGFNVNQYPLNPGMSQTFPWLSSIAQNYQEYKFHGLIFEFRSLITDFVPSGAPGVVIMATNYNADLVAYTTKQQMENSEFAVSVKPTINLMHGVECADGQTILPERFVRSAAVPTNQDLRLYDLGLFQFATQQNPVQDIGELWVSYCVEFFKPILPPDIGGTVLSGHSSRTTVSSPSPLGLIQVLVIGNINLFVTSASISWTTQPALTYQVTINWSGASTAGVTLPGTSISGIAGVNLLNNDTSSFALSPSVATTSTSMVFIGYYKSTSVNPSTATINFTGSGVLPAGGYVDVLVTELDSSITV